MNLYKDPAEARMEPFNYTVCSEYLFDDYSHEFDTEPCEAELAPLAKEWFAQDVQEHAHHYAMHEDNDFCLEVNSHFENGLTTTYFVDVSVKELQVVEVG